MWGIAGYSHKSKWPSVRETREYLSHCNLFGNVTARSDARRRDELPNYICFGIDGFDGSNSAWLRRQKGARIDCVEWGNSPR